MPVLAESVKDPVIIEVTLDQDALAPRSAEAQHECRTALADLLEENSFYPCDGQGRALFDGPYRLHLSVQDNRLRLLIRHSLDNGLKTEVLLPASAFRSIIKDYFLICDSYHRALQGGNPRQVEAIDMGRRGMHNEGSELLEELLQARVKLDFDTSRRLFTLLCALHMR